MRPSKSGKAKFGATMPSSRAVEGVNTIRYLRVFDVRRCTPCPYSPRILECGRSMARRNPIWLVAICAVLAALAPRTALAFGPLAHRVAGLLAEPKLCAAARSEVASLGRASLADVGVWADTIR